MLKNIVYITAVVAAFALLWIVFSIKHNFDNSTITPETHTNISPITPSFDTKTLDQLKSRTSVPVDLSTPGIASEQTTASSNSATQIRITPQPTVPPLSETTPVASSNAALH